jgi:hypothetical protein
MDARDKMLHARFRAADDCVAFAHVHPALGGGGFHVLGRSRGRIVEVMVHPQADAERAALFTPEWGSALARCTLGSYRDV